MKTTAHLSSPKRLALVGVTALAAAAMSIPAAGAAENSTSTTELTLNGAVGTVSITAPTSSLTTPINLGSLNTGLTGPQALPNSLGSITVSDTSTGLLRVATVSVSSTLNSGATGFCQDADDDITGGITCTGNAEDTILSTAVSYDFNNVAEGGDGGTAETVEADGAFGVANAVFTQVLPGSYTLTWNPKLSITMLPTQAAGTYYGSIYHSVTTV